MFTQISNNLFWSKVDKTSNPNGCWEWTGPKMPAGYGKFYYNSLFEYSHRYSFTLSNGPIPPGLVICHRCDNPSCVNPEHLFLGTYKDNAQDCLKKGRHKFGQLKGSKNASAKLTEDQVLKIRESNKRYKEIATEYGVSEHCISEIRRRITWKHI